MKPSDPLLSLLNSKKLEPYIRHIRFPKYKNLKPDTKIEFLYPITVLVGQNGTNKSSVLRALYGSPKGFNLGNLWFSTNLDPINQSKDDPHCFIYGYISQSEKKIVEVLKTRVNRKDDPDYWEPSRPIAKYGMEMLKKTEHDIGKNDERSETRWNPITKDVVYIDFRASLSAYDKFFYHGELKGKDNSYKNKKDFIRKRSPFLKKSLENNLTNHTLYKNERIIGKENTTLSNEELELVSVILGRQYTEIKIIRHKYYNCDAYTCWMKAKNAHYTEAFAGSGEFSIVKIVHDICRANDSSLILLDEPEVSLHPGAQERLVHFIKEKVKKHKHQVIISTHSPSIVRLLPKEAIKVFIMDESGYISIPRQHSLPEEAFFHLGEPISGKKKIIVEDELATELVKKILRVSGLINLVDIKCYPGGAQTLWADYLSVYSVENRNDILAILDGDQKPKNEIEEITTISVDDIDKIDETIKNLTGCSDIHFGCDGNKSGGNKTQKMEMKHNFINWASKYVSYLPGDGNPEEFLWKNMEHDDLSTSIEVENDDYKGCFVKLTKLKLELGDSEHCSAQDILTIQKMLLRTLPISDELTLLSNKIVSFLE